MNRDFTGLSKEDLIELLLKSNKENSSLKNKVTSLSNNVKTLTEDVRILKRYIFAKKNEKVTKEDKLQGVLFDELEECLEDDADSCNTENSPILETSKKKPGRKPISDTIPRENKTFDVAEKDTLCPCCKKKRPQIASKSTEELFFSSAKIVAKKYTVLKYGECDCEEFQNNEDLPRIVEAKAPKRFIPGGIASPSLVAQIITNKFCDALPFYRQNKIFNRIGVDISRQNMSNWSLTASKKCEPLIEHMRKYMVSGKLINMDETIVQVLNEKDRAAESKSYMWVMTGGNKENKVVIFNYAPTRKQETPLKLLKGFNSVLQTDGYQGYNKAVKEYGLWHVGCLTHAKRKFFELAKVTKKVGKAHKGVSFFTKLYNVQKNLTKMNLTDDVFVKKRRELSIPIWQEFYKWLHDNKNRVAPDSPLSRAINYSINQYQNLVRYLKYPYITPDNNIAENAIRPFCLGRKNWLFNNSPKGAYSSAVLYSLVETAKINKIEPDKYLNYIFSEIADKGDNIDLDSLMPWNVLRTLK